MLQLHRKCRPQRRRHPAKASGSCRFRHRDNTTLLVTTTRCLFLTLLLHSSSIPLINAFASNKAFCGTSWEDASSNCLTRAPCPNASDSDCFVPGHTCFGNTMCDSNTPGHGSMAPKNPMANLNLPDYADNANTRFCQNQWNLAGEVEDYCQIDLWCGDNSQCPSGKICHYGECHIHDLHMAEIDMDQFLPKSGAKPKSPQQMILLASEPNDPIRTNYCGKTWDDASAKCGTWCLESADECPGFGEKCFAETLCYNEAGTVPSMTPTTYAPTTSAPVIRLDPINFRFCGKAWDRVTCSLETWCPNGDECGPGEVCYTKQLCNAQDYTPTPTLVPTGSPILSFDHPSYFKFCGKSFNHAVNQCSLKTACEGDGDCPNGAKCYGDLPYQCNSFFMEHPELDPGPPTTAEPTGPPPPSMSPTTLAPVTKVPTDYHDPINMRFCGTAWDRVECSIEGHCPQGNECRNGEICFTKYQCNIHDLTMDPTPNPTPAPIQPRDHTSYLKFCGRDAMDAVLNCQLRTYCGSEGASCAGGMQCFQTPPGRCNAYDMMYQYQEETEASNQGSEAPSPAPIYTRPPVERDDPTNLRFCGTQWDRVNCSLEGHCPLGTECPEGELCFTSSGCNAHDLTMNPTDAPSLSPVLGRQHPSYLRHCGINFSEAVTNCSLETFCASDGDCNSGETCYSNLPRHCNAFNMLYPELMTGEPTKYPTPLPTSQPTPSPTPLPTPLPTNIPTPHPVLPQRTRRPTPMPSPDRTLKPTQKPNLPPSPMPTAKATPMPSLKPIPILNSQNNGVQQGQSYWCGETQPDANRNCAAHSFWCVNFDCPLGWHCFQVDDDACGKTPPTSTAAVELPSPSSSNLVEVQLEAEPEAEDYWCGESKSAAIRNCAAHSFWCTDLQCPLGMHCFLVDSDSCGKDSEVATTATNGAKKTEQPSPFPTKMPTERPTNHPTRANIISKPAVSEKEPFPKPVPQRVTEAPIPQPVTEKPTKWPTQKPVTSKPTSKPTSVAGGLVSSILTLPSPKATTSWPSRNPATPNPTSYPTKYPTYPITNIQPSTTSNTEPAFETNKQPNGGGEGKLTISKGDSSSKETTVLEKPLDSAPSDITITASSSNNRAKSYCINNLSQIESECPYALECISDIPCPSPQTCVTHHCVNRPRSNGSLDLCPAQYVGIETRDCFRYYLCDEYGYVGPTYTCQGAYKYSKSVGRCVLGHLVNDQCKTPDSAESATLPSATPPTAKPTNAKPTLSSFFDSYESNDEEEDKNLVLPPKAPTNTTGTTTNNVVDGTSPPTSSPTEEPPAETSNANSWSQDGTGGYDLSKWYTATRNGAQRGSSKCYMLLSIQVIGTLSFALLL